MPDMRTFLIVVLLISGPLRAFAFTYADESRVVRASMRSVAAPQLESYFNTYGSYPAMDPGDFPCLKGLAARAFLDEHKITSRRLVSSGSSYFLRLPGILLTASAVTFFSAIAAGISRRNGSWPRMLVYTALVLLIAGLSAVSAGPIIVNQRNPHWPARKEYNYWTDGQKVWILQSVGHDMVRNLTDLSCLVDVSTSAVLQQVLSKYSYDPTNGVYSTGDLFLLGGRQGV